MKSIKNIIGYRQSPKMSDLKKRIREFLVKRKLRTRKTRFRGLRRSSIFKPRYGTYNPPSPK